MKATTLLGSIAVIGLAPALAAAQGAAVARDVRVSSQGMLEDLHDASARVSPRGSLWLELEPLAGDFHELVFAVRSTAADGARHEIPRLRGQSFLASDLDRIIVIEERGHQSLPTRLAVLDLDGRELFARDVPVLTDPMLSPDGTRLGFRSSTGLVVLDLASLAETTHADLETFTLGNEGALAGLLPGGENEVIAGDGRGERVRVRLDARPRRLEFSETDDSLWILTARALLRLQLSTGSLQTIYQAPAGGELRDLRVTPFGLQLGMRRVQGSSTSGWLLRLGSSGRFLASTSSSIRRPLSGAMPGVPLDTMPWLLSPNSQHPVGNTYGEYQNYGGSPYLHPGVDVLGNNNQPVYAVADGLVKAVLTTGGSLYWRVAIGFQPGPATTEGYLYAHLVQSSIAVNVGDTVTVGQYLGDLVPWPVSGFTHCHFARIEESGSTWSGSWLCTENPQVRFENQTETQAPVFAPAYGSNVFAFCDNESSSYQSATSLSGKVDIIARVSDAVLAAWACTVQEIRYTIYPQGAPNAPLVKNKLAVYFDMDLDTYQNGPIDPFLVGLLYKQDSVCQTRGDYNHREFYHIITNSDGDLDYEASDAQEAWDTSLLSDGNYVIEVTARDVAGNSTTASMVVSTNNGNP